METYLVNLIDTLAFKNGMLSALFAYIGVLRFFIKPVMSLFLHVSKLTPTKVDDKFFDKINKSWWYNTIVYMIDWFTSYKVRK